MQSGGTHHSRCTLSLQRNHQGHSRCLDDNHLDVDGRLEALQVGCCGTGSEFRVGIPGDGAILERHMEQSMKKAKTNMIQQSLVLPLMILMGSFAMAEDTLTPLFDFTGADAAKEWQTVNDGVMGGVSKGEFKITDEKTMKFFGTLSLENNGGFASVRTKGKKLGLEKGDTLVAKVRGDGREYTVNLYLDRRLTAFSYRAAVETKKDEWIEIKVQLDKFEATSFGRVLKGAGEVKPDEIYSVGFLLGDEKAGPFKMEVEWIKVERAASPK